MRLIDADHLKELFLGISPEAMFNPSSVIDAIDREPTVPTFGQWISAKDRLPEIGKSAYARNVQG